MREASNYLIGSHDFRNFAKMDVGNGVVQFVRNMFDVKIEPLDINESDTTGKHIFFLSLGKCERGFHARLTYNLR